MLIPLFSENEKVKKLAQSSSGNAWEPGLTVLLSALWSSFRRAKFANRHRVNVARPASPAIDIRLGSGRAAQAADSAGEAASWPFAGPRAKQCLTALHLLNLPGVHAVAVATSRLGKVHRRVSVAQ
jgi:hypothetical protein